LTTEADSSNAAAAACDALAADEQERRLEIQQQLESAEVEVKDLRQCLDRSRRAAESAKSAIEKERDDAC
jgi:hypothetical protein